MHALYTGKPPESFTFMGGGKPHSGYKVKDDGDAMGRPVGVATAKDGALLVADDVGNTLWRVTPAAPRAGG